MISLITGVVLGVFIERALVKYKEKQEELVKKANAKEPIELPEFKK